jgi:maltose O-acetyltransferase
MYLYRIYGLKVGTGSFISPRCFVNDRQIVIGDRCYVNYGCFLDGPVTIGNDCLVGMEALLCASSHEIGPTSRRAGANKSAPVVIGNGCWIGARAIILPGVTIGEGSIVGAGAVVTKDCEPNSLYAGSPAHLIRRLPFSEITDFASRMLYNSETISVI